MTDIYDLTYGKLKEYLISIGEKPSKADMIFPALYGGFSGNFDDLPVKAPLREKLKADLGAGRLTCEKVLRSDAADKYLFRLNDGSLIESVLMKHSFGNNVCVSTEVGCDMGCAFCSSGKLRKIRPLSTAEMVGQMLYIRDNAGERISGVAIMGIGEPLDNFDCVSDFIDILLYQKGFDIGVKHITLSTCGLVPQIYKLAERDNAVNLAISLHAPNDELRTKLMPVNKAYPLSELIEAAEYYSKKRNRRITLEYVMLKGVNDSDEHAAELSRLIGGRSFYVNLIRYNSGTDDMFECSEHERIMRFYDILKKHGIGVTMRREMGASVNAACGQLRAEAMK